MGRWSVEVRFGYLVSGSVVGHHGQQDVEFRGLVFEVIVTGPNFEVDICEYGSSGI